MSISGIKKIAIFEPISKTVVQLNTLSPDGSFTKEPQGIENAKGSLIYGGDDANFECNAFDMNAYAQLETWMKQETPVRFVTYGVEDNILWYEDSKITVKKNYGFGVGNRNSFLIQIKRKGGSLNIKSIVNLILGNSLWQDANADGLVDTLVAGGSYSVVESFSNNEQLIQSVTNAEVVTYTAQIVYPIAGARISSSFETSLNQNTINSADLKAKDSGGALLSTVGLLGGAATLTTPAATYYISYEIVMQMGTAGSQTKIKVPYGVNY